jgi:hypothetical protein
MFPFIQCHHTRGRALSGGFSNPLFSESAGFWLLAEIAAAMKSTTATGIDLFHALDMSLSSPAFGRSPYLDEKKSGIRHWLRK